MYVELQVDESITAEGLPDPEDVERIVAQIKMVLSNKLDASSLHGDICVRICSEAESRAMNNTFRHIDKPTNVLSFPVDEISSAVSDAPLGDLAICWPVVVSEAGAQGKAVQSHFTHMVVHGVLHLLGYDHDADADAAAMEAVEVEILDRLHICDPYGD